jgi:hypothetical protein
MNELDNYLLHSPNLQHVDDRLLSTHSLTANYLLTLHEPMLSHSPQGIRGLPLIHKIEVCELPPHLKPTAEVLPTANGGNGTSTCLY